jgi:hypothetical protein
LKEQAVYINLPGKVARVYSYDLDKWFIAQIDDIVCITPTGRYVTAVEDWYDIEEQEDALGEWYREMTLSQSQKA